MIEVELVTFITNFLAGLPEEVAMAQAAVKTLANAYETIKETLSATTQAQVEALLAQVDTQTDADIAKLDADATAAGAT
jgi:hypothetical protein